MYIVLYTLTAKLGRRGDQKVKQNRLVTTISSICSSNKQGRGSNVHMVSKLLEKVFGLCPHALDSLLKSDRHCCTGSAVTSTCVRSSIQPLHYSALAQVLDTGTGLWTWVRPLPFPFQRGLLFSMIELNLSVASCGITFIFIFILIDG